MPSFAPVRVSTVKVPMSSSSSYSFLHTFIVNSVVSPMVRIVGEMFHVVPHGTRNEANDGILRGVTQW